MNLKISLQASKSSHQISNGETGGRKDSPILYPSQIFGLICNAAFCTENAAITNQQFANPNKPIKLDDQRIDLLKKFSNLKIVSMTKSHGGSFLDVKTYDLHKYSGYDVQYFEKPPNKMKNGEYPPLIYTEQYFADPHFVAILRGDDGTIDFIKNALNNPKNFLYVGRKNCSIDNLRTDIIDDDQFVKECQDYLITYTNSKDLASDDYDKMIVKAWPSDIMGKYNFIELYYCTQTKIIPNSEMRKNRPAIYVFDKCYNRDHAHAVVYSVFGDQKPTWFIDKHNIVVYSKFDHYWHKDAARYHINTDNLDALIECNLEYVPRYYGDREEKQKLRDNDVAKIINALGTKKLPRPRKISIEAKKKFRMSAFKFNLKLSKGAILKSMFNRIGRLCSYGYGSIKCDYNELI